jgi:8-oxo-dGTP diphosphatase
MLAAKPYLRDRMADNIVKVGVGVFVFKDGKFLMMQRQGAHGAGSWSVPGGHAEFGENFADTAVREVMEETGMTIKNVRFAAVTNDLFKIEGKHYVTIWMASDWADGEATIIEPHRCMAMGWRTFDDLPEPLFVPWENLFRSEFIHKLRVLGSKKSAG